ncbi:hypothetical protein EGY05_01690 [Chryseobacterium arthrosphaerae]|nr:hypothetical protein EGY05_01690 [Chryseobacterium arthrosphaerae]
MQHKLPFHFDMETADPDDSMTLAVLATHPKVHLVSVSVHPGGTDQIGVVRRILQILDREDIRIGAGTPKSVANRVSDFHRKWVGKFEHSEADDTAANIMAETLRQFPECTLLSGAALTNPHALFETGAFFFPLVLPGRFCRRQYRSERISSGKIRRKTHMLNL